MHILSIFFAFLTLLCILNITKVANGESKREKTHLKKDPRDFTDRDVESLYDEWEVRFTVFVILHIAYI